jgi:arsenate reductase (thioredoxin)
MITVKRKVLFLCTGNSARSQMAEGLLRLHGSSEFKAFSAGLEPKGIHPLTIQVMKELGYDMAAHTSKSLNEYIGKVNFDYLITVCSQADAKCPVFPGSGQRLHWGFEDPAVFVGSDFERLAKFRQTRDLIETRILQWMQETGFQASN